MNKHLENTDRFFLKLWRNFAFYRGNRELWGRVSFFRNLIFMVIWLQNITLSWIYHNLRTLNIYGYHFPFKDMGKTYMKALLSFPLKTNTFTSNSVYKMSLKIVTDIWTPRTYIKSCLKFYKQKYKFLRMDTKNSKRQKD